MTRSYADFIANFSADTINDGFMGDLADGLNVCEEICDRHCGDNRVSVRHEGLDGTVTELTYEQLRDMSARFAAFLTAQGIGRGDRVAALLPRSPALIVVLLGTLRVGGVYQPLFTAFGPSAIEYRVGQSGAKLIVSDAENWSKLDGVADCPPLMFVGDGDAPAEPAAAHRYDDAMAHPADFTPVRVGPNEPMLQMFTSGTTGKSKGVSVPVRALVSFDVYMRDVMGVRADDVYWNIADPGWAYGLYYALVGPMLIGVTTHFNQAGFTVDNTFSFLERHGITNLAGAPTAYRMLMAATDELAKYPGIRVERASSAGEPLNPEIVTWMQDALGAVIRDQYGQTETAMFVCNYHEVDHQLRDASMGYALPGHRAVALNDDFEEVGAGETGQLAVDRDASPLLIFQGYDGGRTNPYHGKYYLTGDMVIAHGDGSFSYTGRDDDIIASAGYRIGPADVESALIEHPAVIESGVVGKPDEKRGHIVKAYVVLKPGINDTDALAEELQQHVRNRLSTHAFPREVTFVDELPKTPSGKIQRFILRERAASE